MNLAACLYCCKAAVSASLTCSIAQRHEEGGNILLPACVTLVFKGAMPSYFKGDILSFIKGIYITFAFRGLHLRF